MSMGLIGKKTPDFNGMDSDGRNTGLKDYMGKIIVLYFYPRALTPGCTREAIRFNELAGEFMKYNAVVIGVSTDSVDRLRRFKEKYGLENIVLLSDPEGVIASKYGVLKKSRSGRVSVKRVTFIIDFKGIVRHVLQGIKPEKHADESLRIIKKLGESQD